MTISMLALAALLAAAPAAPKHPPVQTFLYSDLGSGAEAALPRHLIWALVGVAPEVFGATEQEFFDRYGMIRNPASEQGLPFGVVPVKSALGAPYLALNCAWCHVGKVAGRVYFGAGNRALRQAEMTHDIVAMGKDPRFTASRMIDAAAKEARRRGQLWHLSDSFELAIAVMALRHEAGRNLRSDNTEAGPGFSIPSIIAMEKRFGLEPPDRLAAVKVPSIWSYGDRRLFSAGANFQGNTARTMMAPEFTKGRDPKNILANVEPFDTVLAWMVAEPPPKFPFAIDAALAQRGEPLYAKHCGECHGTNWQGNYQEQIVPIEEVATDPDRLHAFAEGFAEKAMGLKFPDVKVVNTAGGYVAVQHDGLWARAPFLHNGSVPSLRWMLEPPDRRPKIFYLGQDIPYSPSDVGDVCVETTEDGVKACAAPRPGLFRFDARKQGRGNGGHTFGTGLGASDKAALLEYLKTL